MTRVAVALLSASLILVVGCTSTEQAAEPPSPEPAASEAEPAVPTVDAEAEEPGPTVDEVPEAAVRVPSKDLCGLFGGDEIIEITSATALRSVKNSWKRSIIRSDKFSANFSTSLSKKANFKFSLKSFNCSTTDFNVSRFICWVPPCSAWRKTSALLPAGFFNIFCISQGNCITFLSCHLNFQPS